MLLTKNRLVTCKYGIFLVQHRTSERAVARRSLWACGTRSVFVHTPMPWLHAAKRLCLRYSKNTHKFLPFLLTSRRHNVYTTVASYVPETT
jgi:hypothetical protein